MDTRTRITPAPSTEPAAVHPTELPAVHPLERAASAWLGHIAADKPELEAHWAGVDRFGHAALVGLDFAWRRRFRGVRAQFLERRGREGRDGGLLAQ